MRHFIEKLQKLPSTSGGCMSALSPDPSILPITKSWVHASDCLLGGVQCVLGACRGKNSLKAFFLISGLASLNNEK